MAIVVENSKDKKRYIYIGASYSYYKDSRPGAFGGSLFPHEEEGEFSGVLVSNEKGEIMWVDTAEISVISIDGKTPGEILSNIWEL